MSRIYEALRSAQASRPKSSLTGSDGLGIMEMLDRRAGSRRELDMDLTVYVHAADQAPFYEHAMAIKGNANGGLLLLMFPVAEGQDLLLINNRTSQEQVCRVVNLLVRDDQSCEVSVAFFPPNPEFWQSPSKDEKA